MDRLLESTFNATHEYDYLQSTANINSQQQQQPQGHSEITLLIYKIVNHMWFYSESFFFPCGLVFNLLLLLVFGISSMGTTKTTRVYYLAMAYGDFGTVLFKDTWFYWLDLGFPFVTAGLNPLGAANAIGGSSSTHWMCGLHLFLWYSHEMFANFNFVAFELHRVIAIYAPLHARHLFTKRGTIITV